MKANTLSKSIKEENTNIKHKDTVLDYGDLDEEVEISERPVGGFYGEDLDEE
jgi:hypothetical protein